MKRDFFDSVALSGADSGSRRRTTCKPSRQRIASTVFPRERGFSPNPSHHRRSVRAMNPWSLQATRVVVTGASRGIGAAIASLKWLSLGASVLGVSRSREDLAQLQAENAARDRRKNHHCCPRHGLPDLSQPLSCLQPKAWPDTQAVPPTA